MDKEAYERWYASRVKHGGYIGGKERPEHAVWRTMHARCGNPRNRGYKYYGARGISVCERWTEYKNFIADMGPRPSNMHSLDRIDNNKGYAPDNCRWATRSEQQKNKTTTRVYTDGNFTGTLSECATYLGMSKELAHYHWKTNRTFEKGVEWRELEKE